MPCNPLDNSTINPPVPSEGFNPNGGFAPQLPATIPDDPFPPFDLEDLTKVFDALNFILPPGSLKPNLSLNFTKDYLDGIYSMLEKFVPFLMLYKFITPILNLIVCIIEVLCAIPRPFKMMRAVRRLFRVCLPEFLALFPAFALIIMILSLLSLILLLVTYILDRILEIIRIIKDNIQTLGEAADRMDGDAIFAITKKLGNLLCSLQNLFPILGLLLLIFEVIKSLANMSFKIPCDSSNNEDLDGCCTSDVCPNFIKNNETIQKSTGKLQYYNQVYFDSGLILPPAFGSFTHDLRKESWQFYDETLTDYLMFNNITHAIDLPAGFNEVFFPQGITYTKDTLPKAVPYTIDIRLFYDPAAFGRTDPKGARYVRILDCIVLTQPYDGVYNYKNTLVSPYNGTLLIQGGKVFEDNLSAFPTNQTLNDLIHINARSATSASELTPLDGFLYKDMEYTFKINHEVLVQHALITLGCVPSVSADKEYINTNFSLLAGLLTVKLKKLFDSKPGFAEDGGEGGIPNIQETIDCATNSINDLRNNLSIENINSFETKITSCLNKLANDTKATMLNVIDIGFDQAKSNFTLDPSIQFTTRSIVVSVDLFEANGNPLAFNVPSDVASLIAKNITPNITFGEIGNFVYDGSQKFLAEITSKTAGNGEITISYNSKSILQLNNPTSIDETPSTSIKKLNYTFVYSSIPTQGDIATRRDDADNTNINSVSGG